MWAFVRHLKELRLWPFYSLDYNFLELLNVLGCDASLLHRNWQQRSSKHSCTCRPVSGRPYSTDSLPNRRIVVTAVVDRTASRARIGANVSPGVSICTVGIFLLTTNSMIFRIDILYPILFLNTTNFIFSRYTCSIWRPLYSFFFFTQ